MSQGQLNTNGWVFTPGALNAIQLQQALKISDSAINQSNHWGAISGGYRQCNLLASKSKEVMNVLKMIEKTATEVIGRHDLVAHHFKLLVAKPGSGPQAPHRDGLSKNQYVVAVYLSHNQTTDVSALLYPSDDLAKMSDDNKAQMDPKYWTSFRNFKTVPGDMMIFAEDVVHRGIYNDSDQSRHVLFTVLGPKDEPHTDKYQYFEWDWYREIYGFGSVEHTDALIRNQPYRPVAHESGREAKKVLRKLVTTRKRKRETETS